MGSRGGFSVGALWDNAAYDDDDEDDNHLRIWRRRRQR